MQDRKSRWLIPGIAFILIIITIIGMGRDFVSDTKRDVDEQNRQYLSELAVQNAKAIKNTVDMQLDKIEAIANIIGNQEQFTVEYTMQILEAECRRSSFKRMAYIPPDGNAVTTDDTEFSVLDRDYYGKALKGKSNVSDAIVDKVGGGYINVYAVPLYHKESLKGVIIATNKMDIFSEILNVQTFYGDGFAYIIQKDGTPVVFSKDSKHMQEFENLFEDMEKSGVDKADVKKIQQDMEQSEDGIIEYSLANIPRVGAYRKIGINDWYVISVVPRQVIYENTDRIVRRNRESAIVTTCLLTALCISIVILNYRSNKKLSYLAYVDSFTGGNNLNKFKMLASQRIAKGENSLYMIWIDIDNFNLINEMYGYKEGDHILLEMNNLIAGTIGKDDMYGRINNDNFLCLMECADDNELLKVGRQFRETFREVLNLEEKRYTVNLTTGVYKLTADETDIEKIIDRTAMAHRMAKKQSSGRKYCFYNDSMREEAVRVKDMEDIMCDALLQGEFEAYLQPKYNMLTGKMEGAEALVRWNHKGKIMSPAEFVPIFDRNGFIANIDLYMLEEVCRMQRRWLDMGLKPLPVSVNQSKPLVYGKGYVEKVQHIVKKYDLPPYMVEIELLERLIHDNITELQKTTDRLHSFGILVCIDDFGSGYSSLNMIKDIRADVLKIDREFLNNAETNQRAQIVLQKVAEMAAGLDMSVVVEGVETKKQAHLLQQVGCYTAQGYLYARPMPADQYESKLRKEEMEELL